MFSLTSSKNLSAAHDRRTTAHDPQNGEVGAAAASEPSIGKAKLDFLKRTGVHFAAGNHIGPKNQAGSTRQEVEGLQRRNPWIPRKRAEGTF
jgi:hypothetical protein